MLLEITHRELRPGTTLVSLAGSVMRGPESAEIEALTSELLKKGCRRLIFDLTGVKRIDSTGIGRFIAALNSAQQAGADLRMASGPGYVRDCFRVTRLDTIFPFFPDPDAAAAD
ncbi:MAG: STAS domain-containing protein [Bryobacteraceae bacterium]